MAERATTLVLTDAPIPRGEWLADLRAHRDVLWMLARKDFQVRYKRASLGVVWAVAVPLIQGAIMAVVFSRVVRVTAQSGFGAYVLAGVLAWTYFAATLNAGATAIVDGAALTDKVWFPRALLVLVPAIANLFSFAVSTIVLLVAAQFIGSPLDASALMIIPGMLLLMAFAVSLSLVLSALHVYFRDVRFLVQAGMIAWLYITPVLYPKVLLGDLSGWLDLNPMTGIMALFHVAVVNSSESLLRPVLISIGFTVALTIIGLEAQRRYDRLFVDQL